MPKISAATVAEHHAMQRKALIEAAVDILVTQGAAAVTPAAVGARAGLARSSVYQYFKSSGALLSTIAEESLTPAEEALTRALADAGTPLARLDAYVTTTVRLAAEGLHRPAAALMAADLPPVCREYILEKHRRQVEPFEAAVRDLGLPDPDVTAGLLAGLVYAAITAVDKGADPALVTTRTLALIHGGLRTGTEPPPAPADTRPPAVRPSRPAASPVVGADGGATPSAPTTIGRSAVS